VEDWPAQQVNPQYRGMAVNVLKFTGPWEHHISYSIRTPPMRRHVTGFILRIIALTSELSVGEGCCTENAVALDHCMKSFAHPGKGYTFLCIVLPSHFQCENVSIQVDSKGF
jgi:hypothetical protein